MLTLSHTNEQSEGKTDHASSSVLLQHETCEQGLQVPLAKPRVALHRPPPHWKLNIPWQEDAVAKERSVFKREV